MPKTSASNAVAIKKETGQRLKRFALSYFDSISAFARAIDLQPNSLHSNYLGGRHFPGAELLIKLHYMGCDVTWLLTGEGLPPSPSKEELDLWYAACKASYDREAERLEVERKFLEAESERLSKDPGFNIRHGERGNY